MSTASPRKFHPLQIIQFAGAFCAFCIGSGFASGQEVLQFFTFHGVYSFGALAICMVFFMWFGSTIMLAGHKLQLRSTNEIFKYYCGPYLGAAFELVVPFFLFCVFVIMVAGTGALLQEYYGLHPYLGRALMALLSILTVVFGLNRMVQIIGFIGPVIIVLSIVVGILGILHNPSGLTNIEASMQGLELNKAAPHWWLSGILYTAFMVFGSAPFFAGMGTEAKTRGDAIWGGLLGGFSLIAAAAVMSTGMLANLPAVFDKQLPALAMAGNTSQALGVGFSVILFLGIYTTAAPMLWSVCNRVFLDKTPKFRVSAVVLGVAAFAGGMLPFSTLVGTVYPYTGYLGILFLLCVFYGQVIKKK